MPSVVLFFATRTRFVQNPMHACPPVCENSPRLESILFTLPVHHSLEILNVIVSSVAKDVFYTILPEPEAPIIDVGATTAVEDAATKALTSIPFHPRVRHPSAGGLNSAFSLNDEKGTNSL